MAKRLDIPDDILEKVRVLLAEKKASKFWSYRLSFAGIAETCGTSKYVVENICYNRARMNPEGVKRDKLTYEKVKRIKKILLDKDFERIKITYRQISDMEGVAYFTVRNIHNGTIYTKWN